MTRVEPVGAFGEGVIVTDRCDRCRKDVGRDNLRESEHIDCEGYPLTLCGPCDRLMDAEAEYYADPFNEAYERARAQGWSD